MKLLPVSERSVAARILLREVLACKVLQPLVDLVEPHNINAWLILLFDLLDEVEPEPDDADGAGAGEAERDARGDEDDTGARRSDSKESHADGRVLTDGDETNGPGSTPAAHRDPQPSPQLDEDDILAAEAVNKLEPVVAPEVQGANRAAAVRHAEEDFDAGTHESDASQGQVADAGWRFFAGELTEEEAVKHLVGRPTGTFLVRARPQQAGQLMVCFVGRRTSAAGTFTQDVRTTHGSAEHGTSSINEVRVYFSGNSFRVLDFGTFLTLASCLRALRPCIWIGLRFDSGEAQAEHLYVEEGPGKQVSRSSTPDSRASGSGSGGGDGGGSATPKKSPSRRGKKSRPAKREETSVLPALVRPRTSLVADLETAVNKVLLRKETEQEVGGVRAIVQASVSCMAADSCVAGVQIHVRSPEMLEFFFAVSQIFSNGLRVPVLQGYAHDFGTDVIVPAYLRYIEHAPLPPKHGSAKATSKSHTSDGDASTASPRDKKLVGRKRAQSIAADSIVCACTSSAASVRGRAWMSRRLADGSLAVAVDAAIQDTAHTESCVAGARSVSGWRS